MVWSHRATRTAGVVCAAVAPFLAVTALVVTRWSPLLNLDRDVSRWAYEAVTARPALERTFEVVAVVAHPWVFRVAMLLAALWLLRSGASRLAWWLTGLVVVELLAVWLLKELIGRVRPEFDPPLVVAGGWSYPSGHAAAAAMGAGVALVLVRVARTSTAQRRSVLALAALVVVIGGVDRVALSVHYPADVLGGWLLGGGIVVATLAGFGIAARRLPLPPANSPSPDRDQRPNRVAVIMNPIKFDDPAGFRRLFEAAVTTGRWDAPLWLETTVDDAGYSMAKAALTAGVDLVVVAGGDGTVRVVGAELAGTGVPVGVVPAGTGNLLARNLGLPLDHEGALAVALTGRDRPIDVGQIDGDGLPPDRFLVMAGLGLDAAIIEGAPDRLKARVGWSAYVVALLRHLRYPALRVDIAVDDGPPQHRRVRTVVIGNVGTLQARIPLMPDASPDDGLLDVVVLAPRRVHEWPRVVWRVLRRHSRRDDRLDRMRGRRVVVQASQDTQRQLDGDVIPPGRRITAQVEPGALVVRVPR